MKSARGYFAECSYPDGEKNETIIRFEGSRRFSSAIIGFACSNSPIDATWNQMRSLPGGHFASRPSSRRQSSFLPSSARRAFRSTHPKIWKTIHPNGTSSMSYRTRQAVEGIPFARVGTRGSALTCFPSSRPRRAFSRQPLPGRPWYLSCSESDPRGMSHGRCASMGGRRGPAVQRQSNPS
jgi:hypothetical protein